jgi:hypothetical protein
MARKNKYIYIGDADVYKHRVTLAREFKKKGALPTQGGTKGTRETIAETYWSKAKKRGDITFLKGRSKANPILYPTVDQKPVTWDSWGKELDRLKDSPFSVTKRIGLTTDATAALDKGIRWEDKKGVTKKISDITGTGTGASEFSRELKSCKRTYPISFNPVGMPNLDQVFEQELSSKIKSGTAEIASGTTTNIGLIYYEGAEPMVLLKGKVFGIPESSSKFQLGAHNFRLEEVTPYENIAGAVGDYSFQIGHPEADFLINLRTKIDGLRGLVQKAKTDKRLSDDIRQYVIDDLENDIQVAQEMYDDAVVADNKDVEFYVDGNKVVDLFGVPLSQFHNEQIVDQIRHLNDPHIKAVHITTKDNGAKVDSVSVKTTTKIRFPFDSQAYLVEYQRLNAATGAVLSGKRKNFDLQMMTPLSDPLLTRALVSAMIEIFGSKKEAIAYLKRSAGKSPIKFEERLFDLPKHFAPLDLKSLDAIEKEVTPARYAGKQEKSKGSVTAEDEDGRIRNSEVLSFLNRNIRQAVFDQMKEPALRNRTGRFASSVKIDGVTDTQNTMIINYVYRRTPYDVFSSDRGKSPWNDIPQRDPAEIINKAIGTLMVSRFGETLRYITMKG